MSNVIRNDVYVRDEKGPQWFNEFLKSLANTPGPTSVQDILNAIHNKRNETVDSVVKSYREQVGLDLVESTNNADDVNTKCASIEKKPFRPLSIRHAEEKQSVVAIIEADPDLVSALDSLCKHSGGNKKIQSLISYLRDRLGNDISFSDQDLIKYLEDKNMQFKDKAQDDGGSSEYVGLVGVKDDTSEEHEDDIADYIKNDGTV